MPSGYLLQDGKDNNPTFPTKFLLFLLFVLRCVQSVLGHAYLRLAFVTVLVQTVTSTNNKCERYKYGQVKQEHRGMYPVVCKILFAVVLFRRVCVLIHGFYLPCKNNG